MDAVRCPHCGKEFPPGSREGLCAACLLRIGLEQPDDAPEPETTEPDGQRFGPYTTIRLLGEGGMGVVYLANQEHPIRRTVALKVIKRGMSAPEVLARFDSERDALALMDHPNIARVFDAGTTADGRPYFAMEYVSGRPIVEYCDANRLTTRERLELFREVCLGIHHAHQKGIIHRDVKPSNVLVELQDGRAVAKVIDFGVAKAIRPEAARATVFTEAGILIGTPEYMSPEQACLAPVDLDTATDIYSLGVMLYELLVGALPFESGELRRAGYLEILRRVREDEPPSPSSRLKTLGETSLQIATRRRTDIRSLERDLRGDLECITMHALEKDRARRYSSASELAADIARHLNDEPVLAGPPDRLYRTRKFVRKNRLALSAAVLVLVSLISGMAASFTLYLRAERHRESAEREGYVANLANAEALLEASDYEGARERLFRCTPRLRGWEWRLLYARSDTTVARLQGTGDPVLTYPGTGHFAFAPDGSKVFYCMDRTVHAWTMPGWQRNGDFGVFGHILGIAGDGSRILTRSVSPGEPQLLVVEPFSRRTLATLDEHSGAQWAAFDRQGERAATAATDGSIRVWDLHSGKPLVRTAPTGPCRYPRITFSPDGRFLAAIVSFTEVRLLDSRSGRVLHTLRTSTGFGSAFSPDSKSIATVDGGSLVLWDAETGEEKQRWHEADALFAAAFSPDGSSIVTGAQNSAVRIWEIGRGSEPPETLAGNLQRSAAVAFSPDGAWVFSGSAAGGISIWDAPTHGKTLLAHGRRPAGTVAMSADGTRLAAASRELKILDTLSGRVVAAGAVAQVSSAGFDARGEHVVAGTWTGGVHIVDAGSGAVLRSWNPHRGRVESVAYSPEGRYVASGGADRKAVVSEADTGEGVSTFEFAARVTGVAYSPDGSRLAIAIGDPSGAAPVRHGVSVWEPQSRKLLFEVEGEPGRAECAEHVAFSADGARLAVTDTYLGTVRVADASTGRVLASLKGHRNQLKGVVFSPDGRLIASSARDNTIRIWDAVRYEPLLVIRRPAVMAWDLTFSPDGATLYSQHLDGEVRIWSTISRHAARAAELVALLKRKYELMADLRAELDRHGKVDDALRSAAMQAGADVPDLYRAAYERLQSEVALTGATPGDRSRFLCRAQDLVRTSPGSVEAWSLLGAALYRNGLYSEAVSYLAKASAAHHDDSADEAILAMAYYRTGQADRSREALFHARTLAQKAEPYQRELMSSVLAEAEALVMSGKR
jgi:WD40 repeat protein/serine/threonine protein kinase